MVGLFRGGTLLVMGGGFLVEEGNTANTGGEK